MKTRLFLAATLTLAVSACAPAATNAGMATGTAPGAATSASVNPVGRYEFTTSFQGQPITGGILVAGTPGAYTGQITTSVTPPLPISSITAMGQEMVVTGNTPDGVLTIRVNFTDATAFAGAWEWSGDSGSLTGRRVM